MMRASHVTGLAPEGFAVDNELIAATDSASFARALAAVDTNVPLRSEGRTKQQTERYACVHLLATLAPTSWTYPLALSHGDRPDFLLSDAQRHIGIEHAEVVPQNEAHGSVLREQGLGPEVYFIQPALPAERRKRASRLRREILADAAGGAWIGDSAERQWADAMAHFIRKKAAVAQLPGFQRFESNWLLLYDNWPLPTIKAALAAQKLSDTPALAEGLVTFDRIFILDEQTLWEFAQQVPPTLHVLRRPQTGA
jgi:hypothetical protein